MSFLWMCSSLELGVKEEAVESLVALTKAFLKNALKPGEHG